MPATPDRVNAWVATHRRVKALREQYLAEKALAARTYEALQKAEVELAGAAQDLAAD